MAALSVFLLLVVIHEIQSPIGEQGFKVYQANGDYESIEALMAVQGDADSKPIFKPAFKELPHNYINLGSHPSAWLKITDAAPDNILLVQRNAIKRAAQLYYQSGDKVWHEQTLVGTAQFHNHLVTNLPKQMATGTFYLRLHGRYLRATIELLPQPLFFDFLQRSAVYDGLYYGMLLLFIVYNLMLYIRLKTASYLAYSALLTTLLLWFLSGQGWLTFIFPNIQWLQHITVVLGLMLAISAAEFAKHYLRVKTLSIRLFKVLSTLQLVIGAFLLAKVTVAEALPPMVYSIGYGVGLTAALALMAGCFAAALLGVRQGKTSALYYPAWYYIAATVLFFVMAFLMGLSAGNIIELPFSWRFLQLASVVEVVIFSAGLVSIVHQQRLLHQQQRQQKHQAEAALAIAQAELVTQLQVTNQLKDNIMKSALDPKLFPQLAKITNILPHVYYIKASGNWCQVSYQKGNANQKSKQIDLECNLQNLIDSFGEACFVRVHKSYLINPQQSFILQRRTSADYDLNIKGELIPVGRKYLNEVKTLV